MTDPAWSMRAVESEGPSALLGTCGTGDERVARGAADALADAIEETKPENRSPARGEADERPHRVRERVAADDERLRRHAAVGEPAGDELQDAGRGLRKTLDQADDRRPGAERGRQEDRQQRRDHLARRVVQQRHETEDHDRAGECCSDGVQLL